MNSHFERAQLLYHQSRYDMAEESLRRALGDDPDFAMAHGYLALCLLEREEWKEATAEAERAIGLAPDIPFMHFVLARVLLARRHFEEAEQAAMQAVELNPYDADLHHLLGNVYLAQRRWPAALDQADEGLRLDADHAGCANLRATALVQLGRKDEAERVMEGVLARDPEDAFSHANQGWTALHQSDPKKALEHFREALRLEPTLEFAQAGMVEALKARFLFYRIMLRWFLWMATLGQKWQWGIILAIYFGTRFVFQAANDNPGLGIVLWPIYALLVGFAAMTWLASPLFNLMLKLNRFGRYILTPDQRRGANAVGACLLLALSALIFGLVTDNSIAQLLALVCALFTLVMASLFQVPSGWPRYVMSAAALSLAGVAFYAFWLFCGAIGQRLPIGKAMIHDGWAALNIYFPGILIFNVAANVLMSRGPAKL